jgi:hypothetical protein
MLKVGEEQQPGKVQRHRRTQIQEIWSRFEPRQKRAKRTPEPGDE